MKSIYKIVAEKDQLNIEELKHRIELANLLANEVDDKIFSGVQLSPFQWKDLKKTAQRNKAFLIKAQKDRRVNIFLHLQENQELSKRLIKQLEQSLVDAIERLTASINVIKDNEQPDNGHEPITTLEGACNSPGKFEEAKEWFVKMGSCDADTLHWRDRKNGHKTVLANYLWSLHGKGFTRELNAIEIMNIADNTFGVKIGISTIQHAH